ncbi:MAG: ATP synthase F1 subunit gamma [Candidatus Zixiibacteriota bacterium]|jgi:F-type H+-transporting ATPase subunit gamma
MATLRAVRQRIGSVEKIREITAAMKTVSAVKVRNAQTALMAMRPYAAHLAEIISHLATCGEPAYHPLLVDRGDENAILVVISSDRGLCGPFNSNVIRQALAYQEEHRRDFGSYADMVCVGKKGYDFFRRRGFNVIESYTGFFKVITYEDARAIGKIITDAFLAHDVDRVDFLYHHFFSAGRQVVTTRSILPIRLEEMLLPGAEDDPESAEASPACSFLEYLFEPDSETILGELLPLYVNVQVWRVLQEHISSEHGARMMAMESATRNCGDLLGTLTLDYNKARQAAITKELIEVTSASEGLR